MLRTRFGLLSLGLAVVLCAGAARSNDKEKTSAQDPPRRQRPDRDRPAFRGFGQLLSPRLIQELDLNEEQKAKVEKISRQFEEKQQATFEKLREEVRKARESGTGEAAAEIREKIQEQFEGVRKAREDALAEVKAVLNDEQKKKFAELQRRQGFPRRPGDRPDFRGGFSRPGQVLPPALQDRLNLTAEQKEQLEKLQADVTEKLNKILTEEQRQRLERMGRFGGRGGNRPDRRNRSDRPPQERD